MRLQLPRNVAEEWTALYESDTAGGRRLGHINKRSRTLELSDAALKRGKVEGGFELAQPQSDQLPTLLFSGSGADTSVHTWLHN